MSSYEIFLPRCIVAGQRPDIHKKTVDINSHLALTVDSAESAYIYLPSDDSNNFSCQRETHRTLCIDS